MEYIFLILLLFSCGKKTDMIMDQLAADQARINNLQRRIIDVEKKLRDTNDTLASVQSELDKNRTDLAAYAEKANQAFNAIQIKEEEMVEQKKLLEQRRIAEQKIENERLQKKFNKRKQRRNP